MCWSLCPRLPRVLLGLTTPQPAKWEDQNPLVLQGLSGVLKICLTITYRNNKTFFFFFFLNGGFYVAHAGVTSQGSSSCWPNPGHTQLMILQNFSKFKADYLFHAIVSTVYKIL